MLILAVISCDQLLTLCFHADSSCYQLWSAAYLVLPCWLEERHAVLQLLFWCFQADTSCYRLCFHADSSGYRLITICFPGVIMTIEMTSCPTAAYLVFPCWLEEWQAALQFQFHRPEALPAKDKLDRFVVTKGLGKLFQIRFADFIE